jgi:hypothetical protein
LAAVRTSVGCRFRKRAAIVSFLCQTALIQIKASA